MRNPEIRTSRTCDKRKQYPGECLAESGLCCSSGKTIFSLHLAPKIYTLLAIKRERCFRSHYRNIRNTILASPIYTCQDCCKHCWVFHSLCAGTNDCRQSNEVETQTTICKWRGNVLHFNSHKWKKLGFEKWTNLQLNISGIAGVRTEQLLLIYWPFFPSIQLSNNGLSKICVPLIKKA